MDNAKIDIRCEGREAFDHAMNIFMGSKWIGSYKHATHYAIVEPGDLPRDNHHKTEIQHPKAPTIVLFWSEPTSWSGTFEKAEVHPLPHKMKVKAAADLVWNWLMEREKDEMAEWIDHDGSMGHGFRIWNEDWTHVGGSPYGIFACRAIYAWYGK